MKSLNLNCTVKFKPTEYGEQMLLHRYDHLYPGGYNPHRFIPRDEKDGYCRMQLWDFMNLFGCTMTPVGFRSVVEHLNIYIDDKDLEEV